MALGRCRLMTRLFPPAGTSLKGHCSRSLEQGERIWQSRAKRRERGLWQRRFGEPLWRAQADFNNPVDYLHWNAVKPGGVKRVADGPHSSFHRCVACGIYPVNWGCHGIFEIHGGE